MIEKSFERELPDGYTVSKTVDCTKDKKMVVLLNIGNLLLTVAAIVLAFVLYAVFGEKTESERFEFISGVCIGFLAFIPYIILHELVHGAAYKLITKEKLTYGINLTCAYCGVPKIYTYRRTALIAVSAPLVIFSVLFLASMAITLFLSPFLYCVFSVLFACHLGGCLGDIYVIYLFKRKYKDASVLMNDTGPKMTFYTKENLEESREEKYESN